MEKKDITYKCNLRQFSDKSKNEIFTDRKKMAVMNVFGKLCQLSIAK